MNRNDEMITLGGGEIDEMELLVRKLKGANSMVEELPVIDADSDENKPADEPIEITIGGDETIEDIGELDFSVDNYDSDEDDDESDEDDDESDESDEDDDESDEDDDESDEDDDESDEDDDESDEDDDDSDEDDDDSYEDDDESDEDDDESDEDDDESDEDDDESDEDDDDSDEDDDDSDEDDDDSDEDDDDSDEDDDDSDEDDDDSDEDDDDSDEDDESDEDDDESDEDGSNEIVIGGGDEPETADAESAAEKPAEETVEEPVKESVGKPAKKSGRENAKAKRNPNLPAPVIGPRDLDKMRAARAEARKLVEDASRNSDDQDFHKRFLISASPHLHCGETTRIVMQDVVIALIPALVMAFALYGWRSLLLAATCVISCVLAEYVCRRVMNRRQTIDDYSAVVTGLLLAFSLPPELNPLFAVIGSIVAIVVVKQMFGGIGNNFANPAVTARIVLMLSFPAAMTTFTQPFIWINKDLDAVTSATPLATQDNYSLIDLLIGNHGGCLGETCAIALLLGGAYLLVRRIISWHIPVAFIGTTALLSLLFGMDPVVQICSGGLLLGAFFMATDYVTSPVNKRGQIIFGIGCGLLTMVIRRFGAMAEGVSFAILLMNILTPHIERMTTPRPFGEEGKQS